MTKFLSWAARIGLILAAGNFTACSSNPAQPNNTAANANAPTKSFEQWLAEFRVDALAAGIRPGTLDTAFMGMQPNERVVELDRQQPESVLTFEDYLARVVPERRIAQGHEKFAAHRAVLNTIAADYSVPARFIVAFWGIETDYGRLGGNFSVINSLTTLAYEGRRAAFFRNELIEALRIIDGGDTTVEAMRGSWAGAMGQAQFMPSTFRKYAVDYNGDGKRDLWSEPSDVFASAANYLAKIGWANEQTWGREVRIPQEFDSKLLGLEQRKTGAEWQALGVRAVDGADLPAADLVASLIQPSGPQGRAFLVYNNFRVILQWNRSTSFAVAVGLLADAVDDNNAR